MTTASPDSGNGRFPARYADIATNRERYRDLVDRLAPHFFRSDPLADDVVALFARLPPGTGKALLDQALDHGVASLKEPPAPVVRFFEAVDHVPLWVDWDRINLGGETYLRTGFLGAGALLCYSLPWGYLSPGANKPLVFSGRLVQRAYRRLVETSRFVLETCLPDGMRRDGAGFKINVRVRLMHAQVRRLLWTSGRWREDEWGAPINQCDLLSANLLFSIIVLDALKRTGFLLSARERDAVMHLWKYSAYVIGVSPEIIVSTEAEAWRIMALIMDSRGAADDDSRTLVHSLMDAGADVAHSMMGLEQRAGWVTPALYGMSRVFLGDAKARELGFPRSRWPLATPLFRGAVLSAEVVRTIVPGARRFMIGVGSAMWKRAIDRGLRGQSARFGLPDRIRRNGVRR
jgi:hypothetical protein